MGRVEKGSGKEIGRWGGNCKFDFLVDQFARLHLAGWTSLLVTVFSAAKTCRHVCSDAPV